MSVPIIRGPVWHEVWPARWGFYRVYECDGGLGGTGLFPGRYLKATVWGLERARRRAEALQEAHDAPPPVPKPVFSTKETAEIEAGKRAGSENTNG
jgi:hypothetical protein